MDVVSPPSACSILNRITSKFYENPKYKCFSPLSIGYALSLLHLGTNGKTYDELARFFGGQLTPTDLMDIFTLLHTMMSNFLLLQENFQFEQQYLDTVSKVANVLSMNFADPNATTFVNNIIEKQTNGMLQNVIDEIDPTTVFVIMNIIYLKMKWANQFKTERTRVKDFLNGTNQNQKTSMMDQINDFCYLHDQINHNQFLNLPYENGAFSMIVMLPNAFNPYPVFDMACLTNNQLFSAASKAEVHVQMPKFTSEINVDMTGDLQGHGLVNMFFNAIDFTNIGKGVRVSKVIHAVKIIVDEEGTEAAAATVVLVMKCCGMVAKPPPIEFNVNRPFAYAVVHNASKLVLFTGTFNG